MKQAANSTNGELYLLREHMREQLEAACLQGQLAQTHLKIPDDTAMTYAFRRAVFHIREAAQTANEIIALNAEDNNNGGPT